MQLVELKIPFVVVRQETKTTIKEKISSLRICFDLLFWVFVSMGSAFSNKHMLLHLHCDPLCLSFNQLAIGALFISARSFFSRRFSSTKSEHHKSLIRIFVDLISLTLFRCCVWTTGLISLKLMTLSFVITLRASTPIFTMIISKIVLHENYGLWTKLSMIPIAGGLILSSSFELSFALVPFLIGLIRNVAECLHNVYAKKLMREKQSSYVAQEIQLWTNTFGSLFLLPMIFIFIDVVQAVRTTTPEVVFWYSLNIFFSNMFSISSYRVIECFSPVTYSVFNTLKRALIIWTSVLIFGNTVTYLSGLGSLIVVVGGFLYSQALKSDRKQNSLIASS